MTSGPTPAMLSVRNLGVRYYDENSGEQVIALENASLEVPPGEFVSIVGASGCGKTTLLNVVGGLVNSTRGEVLVDGKAIRGPGRDRGMVFQDYALLPWKTVRKNVEFGLMLRGMPKEERRAKAERFLKLAGLREDFFDRFPKDLSGGMKQRVAVCRALANEPKMLLMDEPFAAVDALTRRNLQEELNGVWLRTGATILFVTHSVSEAVFLGTRVIAMSPSPGRIIADLTIDLPRARTWQAMTDSHAFGAYVHQVDALVCDVAPVSAPAAASM